MEAGGLATGYAYDCRAGASPADPSNGKRDRLPCKSVVESEVSDQTSDRVKASLTRRREDDRDRRSESGMTAKRRVIGYCCRNGKYHRNVSHSGLNFSMIERGRFGPTDEGQP